MDYYIYTHMYLKVFLLSSASQKKVQELEQRNEEVKEKMKQQNERELRTNIDISSNIRLLVTIAFSRSTFLVCITI